VNHAAGKRRIEWRAPYHNGHIQPVFLHGREQIDRQAGFNRHAYAWGVICQCRYRIAQLWQPAIAWQHAETQGADTPVFRQPYLILDLGGFIDDLQRTQHQFLTGTGQRNSPWQSLE